MENIENHMVMGGSDVYEPKETEITCFNCCEVLVEGVEYQTFENPLTEQKIQICEYCTGNTKIETAEMPIIERDEDDE